MSRTIRSSRFAALATVLLVMASCGERGDPLAPITPGSGAGGAGRMELSLVCAADVHASTVSCAAPSPVTGGADATLLVGSQGTYVKLTSSNVAVVADTFSFDVTVQNRILQALGTVDGVTPDSSGVRVFFQQLPTTTAGTGSVTVANADGMGVFTAAGQPYYQYDGLLAPDSVTGTRRWELHFDPGVDSFVFTVFVSAEVQYPNGWIELNAPANLLAGDTLTISAVRRSAVGNIVPGSVNWTSSDAGVATIDGAGALTAVGPGGATITASAGGLSRDMTLDVCPALAVGGVYTATMPTAARLCFAGGASGTAEYTFMPLNLSTSSALSLTTIGTGIAAVTGPPSPNRIPAGGLTPLTSFDVSPTGRHLQARMAEIGSVAPLLASRKGRLGPSRPRFTIAAGVPSLGDLWSMNVAQGCSGTPDQRTGRVAAISNHLIIVADTANPAGGFTTAQYDSISLEFDSIAYPAVTDNFGAPADADSNGRVVAFFTRAVNELAPPASSVANLGYFTNRDLFSSDPVSGCERSNEGEVLYMLVPDPTGAVNANVRTVSFVRGYVIRTMGHELQHLVNASRRMYVTGASSFEEPWLDEGLSRVAEELMFYRTSFGLAPRSNIMVTNLTVGPSASRRVAAYNTYANNNVTALRSWLQRPDTTGAFRTASSQTTAQEGATWAFLRYASDRVGGSDAAFWSKLVDSNLEGKANLQNAIGADPDAWLRDFTAAMYADDAVTGVAPEYTNPSWNFRSMYTALYGSFQLVPRPLSDGVGLTLSYQRGGATSYLRFGVPSSGFATLTTTSGGVVPSSPFGLVVVRTK